VDVVVTLRQGEVNLSGFEQRFEFPILDLQASSFKPQGRLFQPMIFDQRAPIISGLIH
jgi:hypothetical protein